MVLLVHRLAHSIKHSSKLDNHHQSEALLASLQAFRSEVSNSLFRLSVNSKPGSEPVSLKWVHPCFELLPFVNNAFAKLVVAIDYPMSKWEVDSIEEYLNYTIHLLQLLNSVTSSVSRLDQARVSLSHALSLVENSPSVAAIERMKEIRWRDPIKVDIGVGNGKSKERLCYGKESIVHQALLVMESTGLWVCGIVLSGLNSDDRPYNEMKRKAKNGFVDASLMALDSVFGKEIPENRVIVKEVKEVNEAVNSLRSAIGSGKHDSDAVKELERRLEGLEEEVKCVSKEANNLFSMVMAGRNELLESLRRKKN